MDAALLDRDRQLAEVAQATNNARHVLRELKPDPTTVAAHAAGERHCPLSAGKERRSGSNMVLHPASAFRPVPDQRPVDTNQTVVLEVVDQWNRRQQPSTRSPAVNQHHQHCSSPTYNWEWALSIAGPGQQHHRGTTHSHNLLAEMMLPATATAHCHLGGYNVPLLWRMTCHGKTR